MPIVLSDPVGTPVYPDPADVRQGVTYGPTGAEYVGELKTVADVENRIVVVQER